MQIDAGILSLISSLVALVLGCYVLWRLRETGKPITPAVVTTTIRDAMTSATELTEVAETAAKASEQLWRTGKIERNERFDRAFQYVRHWFPYLDQDTVVMAVEAAIPVVNALMRALPPKAGREDTPPSES